MMARRSPSSAIGAPVVVLMVRMSGSKTCERRGFIRVDLNEILRPRHRQHCLDALLNTGQLQVAAGIFDQAVTIHKAADCRAVDICHRSKVDQDVAMSGG